MADAVITFCKAVVTPNPRGSGLPDHPVMMGSSGRSEAIAIGVGSAQSTTSAAASEPYVVVHAGAACWVALGLNPTALAVASGGTATGVSWPLAAGETREFGVAAGHKVAVITA